ncbi:MAG: polysaccharide biosynthesis/export family protein [Fimbriimonadales bacterium]
MRNFGLLVALLGIAGSALAQAVSSEPYRLRPEDVLAIRVYGEDDMSVDSPINLDGTISVPLLGFLNAAGKTTAELERHITQALKTAEYFVDPKVSVNIVRFRELRASVTGAANRPGEFIFKPGDRVLSLISQAQGYGFNRADLRKSVLIRKGSMEQIPLDLHAMLIRNDMSQNYELRDGDIINIPETRLNRVGVIGFAQRPGQFDWYEGMTLADALSQAGGEIPYRSRMSQIQIQRVTPGREFEYQKFKVDFTRFTSNNDFSQNVALQPGDVIFIPASNNVDITQLSQYANVAFTVSNLLRGNFNFLPRF